MSRGPKQLRRQGEPTQPLFELDDVQSPTSAEFSWMMHPARENTITLGSNPGEFYVQGSGPDAAICFVKFLQPTTRLNIQETDLAGQSFVSGGRTFQFENFFKEVTGTNPKYTAILIAAESIAELPLLKTTTTADGTKLTVRFPNDDIAD